MHYEPEKYLWTDADFEQMGWHDNTIHQINLANDLELDIDYIFKWNEPDVKGLPFTFWISPATLVFNDVKNLGFNFSFGFEDIEIEDIEREQGDRTYHWTIITRQGSIEFNADGYQQFICQPPFFKFGQVILYQERNGYSLERTTSQLNPIRNREDIVQKREKEREDYETAKKRHLKRQELASLIEARENGKLDTKEFLLKKKEIKDQLYSYDFFLKGTIFEKW
ncbi:hypothetical protein [Niabella hirudinis]|uniref:hypothetical protein n=1 Tax=Niabella hirudinis TaxID=1285929 RepID=UPI003EC0B443